MKQTKKRLTNGRQSFKIRSRGMKTMSGFTIIELLLATSVFSLVLLGALAGFLRTGNLFYKGISLTQTQAVTKQVLDDVSSNITSSESVEAPNQDPTQGYTYYCIGSSRYTYILNNEIGAQDSNYSSPSNGGNYGLLKDTLPNNGCAQPCAPGGSCSAPLTNPVEMLSPNMRLSEFLICSQGNSSSLYTVSITVAYGDSSSLSFPNQSTPTCASPSFTAPSCQGSTQTQQFCAVTSLSTSVYASNSGVAI
jgi:type II secretory pathway pseudopilin PulG